MSRGKFDPSDVQYLGVDIEGSDNDHYEQFYDLASKVGIRPNRNEEPITVAVIGDRVVGGLTAADDFQEEPAVRHFSVIVDPDFQSLGIGRALIDDLLSGARSDGFGKVEADVVNDRLRAYLLRLGFVETTGRMMELVL